MDKTEKIVSAIPSAAELEQLAELHKAMGDHTRMRILWHLTQKEYCVSDLAKEIGVTESALSHQLRALRIVRLVRSRKEGKKVIYSLQDEHIGWVLEETYAHISEAVYFFTLAQLISTLLLFAISFSFLGRAKPLHNIL